MASRKKIWHLVTIICAVIAVGCLIYALSAGLGIDQSKPHSALIGRDAPRFGVRWLQGRDSLRGNDPIVPRQEQKPMVLNFWASWCLSCRQEAHLLENLWQTHDGNVLVVGIAVHDEEDAAREFAQRFHKTYPLALDNEGMTAIDYGVTGVPETFIVDGQGVVRFRQIGAVTETFLMSVEKIR